MSVYFDYASSTPIKPEIMQAFITASTEAWANPSALHQPGQQAKAYLEQARMTVAQHIGASNREIIFTSSATESNNLAIQGLLKSIQNQTSIQNPEVIVSPLEHDSILAQETSTETSFRQASVDANGFIIIDSIQKLISKNTVLISIGLINNEIGVIQPISKIVDMLIDINLERQKEHLPTILLHTDAVQSPLYIKLNVNELGVDLMTISSSKIYAPKGVSALYVRDGVKITHLTLGGGQELGIRSGTQNVPAIWAFSQALENAQLNVEKVVNTTVMLRDYLIRQLQEIFPDIRINGFYKPGDSIKRSPNNIHVSLRGFNIETLLTFLDLEGFYVSAGSSCRSGSLKQSLVLKALGYNVDDTNMAHLRITLGNTTIKSEIDGFIAVLLQAPREK